MDSSVETVGKGKSQLINLASTLLISINSALPPFIYTNCWMMRS